MWRKYKGMGFQLTVHLMLLRIETYPWANMKSRAVVRWHSVQDKIVPTVSAPVSMCLEQAWVHHFAFNLDKMWYILTMVKMMMKGLKTKHYGELLKELQRWGRLREVPQLKDRIRTNKWRLQMVVLTIWIKKPAQNSTKVKQAVFSLGSQDIPFSWLSPFAWNDATQHDVHHELRACTQLRVLCCFLHRESLATCKTAELSGVLTDLVHLRSGKSSQSCR